MRRRPLLMAAMFCLAAIIPVMDVAGGQQDGDQLRRERTAYARRRAEANRKATLLEAQEEARRARQVRDGAAAGMAPAAPPTAGPPAVAPSAPPAPDAGLAEVFAQGAVSEPGPQSYPPAIQPLDPSPVAAGAAAGAGARPPAAPVADQAGATVAAGTPGVELFHTGYSRYSQGDYAGAVQAFRQFIAAHPGHELADNAQYWVGECAAAQGEHEAALTAYAVVIESFPFGDRVAEAMLKSAYTLLALGRDGESRAMLHRVQQEFPGSGPARRAAERLKHLADASPDA